MPTHWEQLAQVVQDIDEILILLHDDPDPDAVASGVGLCSLLEEKWGIEGTIAYRGVIGRAENKALVEFLEVELEQLPDNEDLSGRMVALVDTQPGAGNSPVAKDQPVAIVADHHGDLESEQALFTDVRPWIGATATIITQYFRSAGIKPSMRVATGLFYGIKTDTNALSRDTSAADVAAYFYLLPFVDVDAVVEIENAQVPATYFQSLSQAMQAALVYDGVVISYLGETDYPDLSAEVADLLLRLEGVDWVVCMGVYESELYLSVRTRDEEADAAALAQAILGDAGSAGGRNTLAGGQAALDGRDPERFADKIGKRALDHLGVPPEIKGAPLLS